MNLKREFYAVIHKITESKNAPYLNINELKNGYSYKICARNAYVGIWVETEKAFMISRYKVGANSYLFNEYHWDTYDEESFPLGTVKPLKLIEKCSLDLKHEDEQEIIKYLDKLEEDNPIIEGFNSLNDRRESAIKFENRLSGDRFSNEQLFKIIKSDCSEKKAAIALLKKRGYSVESIEAETNT